MKILKIMAFLMLPSLAMAAQKITNPINFGGGPDYSRICTDIEDNHACDASNMIGDINGAASKRRGSLRFANQAISTNPINSIYRVSVDQGTGTYRSIIVTTWDRIYLSTGGYSPQWTLLKKGLITHNQRFTFATINRKVVMTGDALTDQPYQYDIVNGSFTPLFVNVGTDSIKLLAKYVLATNGYLTFANVKDATDLSGNTTYYSSRFYYSLFLQPSSFTASRFINIRSEDGEAVNGLSEKAGKIEVLKDSSITEITYTILNLPSVGGDMVVKQIVSGFGLIATRALQNLGYYDAMLTKSGLIFWNGGAVNVLSVGDQIKPFDTKIKTIIERIIKNNTYQSAYLKYYPKKQWLIFGYEDPYKFPQGRPNSVMVYDVRTGEWWPFYNWLPECFATMDAKGDDGSLLYGDSNDGYVYFADQESQLDDARKELVIDPMDSQVTWSGGISDYSKVLEGTASLKIALVSGLNVSTSTTRQGMINVSEWPDKSKISIDDKLAFKLNVSSYANLGQLRIDLQVGVTVQAFDQFTTSATLSRDYLVSSSGTWAAFEIPLSSFPIPSDWSDSVNQYAPFARSITYYGIRFVATAAASVALNIDDLRLVQATKNPIRAFYLTKQFNMSLANIKDYRQVILTRDKPADSSFSIDVFSDFGELSNRKTVYAKIPKEIFGFGFNGSTGIVKLTSTDFSPISSTLAANPNVKDYMNGIADAKYVYAFEKVSNKVFKLNRSSMSVVVSSFGALGSGATNFNTANQMCLVENTLFVTDTFNHRIKRLRASDLAYISDFGTLGTGTTNLMSPSGITGDKSSVWVFDDGNFRIIQFSIFSSSYGYVLEKKIDTNTLGEGVLQNDDRYVYAAYNKVADVAYYQDVILEKRNKGDLSLVQQIKLRPQNVTTQSTYTISGDFCLLGPYVFIGFTKDLATTGQYYIQKRLKDTFELVAEYSTMQTQFSVAGDALPYAPITASEQINLGAKDSAYIQLKYYDDNLDNTFKLYNHAFALDVKDYEE